MKYKNSIIEAVILDFYGVIYSNFDWQAITQRIETDENKSNEFRLLKNKSNKGLISSEQFERAVAEAAEDSSHTDSPAVLRDPNINAVLIDEIKKISSTVKFGLLSNGSHSDILAKLDYCGVLGDFTEIITSSNSHHYKPEQAAFEYTFQKLGVNSNEVVFIDDSIRHVEAARSYGYKAILFVDNQRTIEELKRIIA